MSKTIFCDIDGTIFVYYIGRVDRLPLHGPRLIDGVLDNFRLWDKLGYTIILTTGRRESTRKQTESQLQKAGIFYDQLIMGIGSGQRVLINDVVDTDIFTATSINVQRNKKWDFKKEMKHD